MEVHLIFYFFISLISLALGSLIYKDQNKSLLFFITLLLIMPTSDQFMFLTSFKGIYFYDYYFFIISVYYLQNTSLKYLKELFIKNKFLISFLSLFIVYQTSLVYIDNIQLNKYLLKDFRPLILFFSVFIFINTIIILVIFTHLNYIVFKSFTIYIYYI